MPVGEGAASRSVLPSAGRNIKAPDRHWGEARRDLQVGARTNRPYGGEAWRAARYAAHAGRITAAHSKCAKVRPATGGTGLRAQGHTTKREAAYLKSGSIPHNRIPQCGDGRDELPKSAAELAVFRPSHLAAATR
jgi:hypothetical protein